MSWCEAISFAELEESNPTGVRVGTKALVLVRRGSAVSAVDALCPHKFGPLEDGTVTNEFLMCPLHDAGFDLATGACRPGDEWAGRLQTYPARIVDGMVEVELA